LTFTVFCGTISGMISKTKKKAVVEKFKTHAKDTGSSAVQVAILSERIDEVSEHLKAHKKDFHSRRGLLTLVGRRRRLLTYLKTKNPQEYGEVSKKLKLK
jgi:small subunit ribosomal protein S15